MLVAGSCVMPHMLPSLSSPLPLSPFFGVMRARAHEFSQLI